jgi:hypothetical protein
MTHRRTILTGVVIVVVTMLATALVIRRGDAPQGSGTRASSDARKLDASTCRAMWEEGFELEGVVGGRESQAYFDMWAAPGNGDEKLASGIVVFPDAQRREVLADAVIGLKGRESDNDCDVQFEGDEDAKGGVWQVRIESIVHVTGTRRLTDGRTEPFAFNVVPETPCDGAGEWRTFSDPAWPITFDYPASWKLTADHDDVNIECPSVTRLAVGGAYLTFERGQFQPPNGTAATENDSSFTEPYWFVKRAGDEWRVKGPGCDLKAGPRPQDDCYPARRSERNGMTVLQAATGEHRLYRSSVGYLGQGGGIVRYLWVLGDRWISLDSTEWSHYDDIRSEGGPVLFDGDAVGDRVVRSVKPR